MWINQLEEETTEKTSTTRSPSPARINLFNTARKELLDKHDIRMKLATSVKKRLEVTEKLKAEIISDRLNMEAVDSNPPGKRWKDMKKHEQEEFIREQLIHNTKYSSRHKYIYDRVAERELQLTRFVEYCDVVGRNPSIEERCFSRCLKSCFRRTTTKSSLRINSKTLKKEKQKFLELNLIVFPHGPE